MRKHWSRKVYLIGKDQRVWQMSLPSARRPPRILIGQLILADFLSPYVEDATDTRVSQSS